MSDDPKEQSREEWLDDLGKAADVAIQGPGKIEVTPPKDMISITSALKEPFDPKIVHFRPGAMTKDHKKAIALAYIDARDVMKRLDDTVGDLWQCRYPFEGCCEIGIMVGNQWLWRSNGAGATAIEGEKGQYSDAFKRAGVMWGIGRYLYYLPNVWVELDQYKKIIQPPELPAWALPGFKSK